MTLTKAQLFKSYDFPSWSFCQESSAGDKYQGYDWSGGFKIKKNNQATNWDKYFKANVQAGLEGTGYIIHRYKRGDGIKKTVVGKTYANYLNANDKKYYGMTGKQFYNFTENDNGYENALFFKTNQKEAA